MPWIHVSQGSTKDAYLARRRRCPVGAAISRLRSPISLAGPTSSSSAAPSIGSAGSDGTATLIGNDATASRLKITQVPFKGTFDGVLTVSTPTEPPLLPSFIEATGNATHLGRFTLDVPHVVNPVTRTGTGRFEFRAADGDMLTADFVGQATVTAPGVLSTVDTATITGGTGRFANAILSLTASPSSLRSFHRRGRP